MGEGMPYHMHKGHTWQTIDRYLSPHDLDRRAARKAQLLEMLRDDTRYPRFTDVFGVIRPKSYTPPGRGNGGGRNPVDALVRHMNEDWFGLEQQGGKWQPQAPYGLGNTTTGFWRNWYGDAEAIVRETTARAIEVSCNVDHGADIPKDDNGNTTDAVLDRNWPIEFWWLCGMRWFHASLTWRHEHGRRRNGVVVVTWITPGNGDKMYHELDSPPTNDDGSYELDPVDSSTRFGSWLVGQPHNDTIAATSWAGTAIGEWPSPVGVTQSRPEQARAVSVVQPSFPDGGVSNKTPEWDY
jgi:hypothetical protein